MIAFDHLRQIRTLSAGLVGGLDAEQIFTVPDGFANHVAWHAGHAIVTAQLLLYGLSGLEPTVPRDLIDRFRKGTAADDVTPEAFAAVMEHQHASVERLVDDHAAGRFVSFERYETSAGITLTSFDEALAFNGVHEGIHLGCMLAMRRLV